MAKQANKPTTLKAKPRTRKTKTDATNVPVEVKAPSPSLLGEVLTDSLATTLANLTRFISKIYFFNSGDSNEQKHWATFTERFPNLQLFWRKFVVPATLRIERQPNDPEGIRHRPTIDNAIWEMVYSHYNVFLHLIDASEHLKLPVISSFRDFYSHLVSASDLAQNFLLKTYTIVLDCRGTKSTVFQGLSREDFLRYAGEWYDKRYSKIYEHYLAKGKWSSIALPTREDIVSEYFEDDVNWKLFETFDISLRQYRNVFIHREAVGEVQTSGGTLIPRRDKIQKYLKLDDVFKAAGDAQALMDDFAVKQEQMQKDFFEIQLRLNSLWERPIKDLDSLLFQEQSEALCRKYALLP